MNGGNAALVASYYQCTRGSLLNWQWAYLLREGFDAMKCAWIDVCNGPDATDCTGCKEGFILSEGLCIEVDEAAENAASIEKMATA